MARLRAVEEERDYWKRLYHEGLDAWHDEITRRQTHEADTQRQCEDHENEMAAMSAAYSNAVDDAQRLTAERDEMKEKLDGLRQQRHDLKDENKRLTAEVARLRAALEPFGSGTTWGTLKAWLVNGAPTNAEGIELARNLTRFQVAADAALTPPPQRQE